MSKIISYKKFIMLESIIKEIKEGNLQEDELAEANTLLHDINEDVNVDYIISKEESASKILVDLLK